MLKCCRYFAGETAYSRARYPPGFNNMSKVKSPDTTELNTQSSGTDAAAASDATGAIDLARFSQSPVPQREYLQLLLAQLRRVEDLEQENRKLLAERGVMNEKYQAQLKIVAALKAENTNRHVSINGKLESMSQTAIDELPEINAAEFQPAQETANNTGIAQGYKAITNTTAALGSSVKSSAGWCGRKVVAILT